MPEVKYVKVLTQMVAPLASERLRRTFTSAGDGRLPRPQRAPGLSAYRRADVEACEAVYQHRMEVNGVLLPFNHEKRTYKALVKKAEAAPKVRRGLSAQLDALTGEADNRDLGDREKAADAVRRGLCSRWSEAHSQLRVRRMQRETAFVILQRRGAGRRAVEQLLRAKMSTAGDCRAWLPACTDPPTGAGGWGPPPHVMHAD